MHSSVAGETVIAVDAMHVPLSPCRPPCHAHPLPCMQPTHISPAMHTPPVDRILDTHL